MDISLLIISFILVYLLPGYLTLSIHHSNRYPFPFRLLLSFSISILLASIIAHTTTILYLPYNLWTYCLGLTMVIGIIYFITPKTLPSSAPVFSRLPLTHLFLLLIIGLIPVFIFITNLQRFYLPSGFDSITHQQLLIDIHQHQSTPSYYPTGLHNPAALILALNHFDPRLIWAITSMMSLFYPLTIYYFTAAFFKHSYLPLFTAILSVGFLNFPTSYFDWGGLSLFTSMLLLGICVTYIKSFLIDQRPNLVTSSIAASLIAAIVYTHSSELITLIIFLIILKLTHWRSCSISAIIFPTGFLVLLFLVPLFIHYNFDGFPLHEFKFPAFSKSSAVKVNLTQIWNDYTFLFADNIYMLWISVIGLVFSLFISIRKQAVRFFLVCSVCFLFLYLDSKTVSLLHPLYSISSWGESTRLYYILFYSLPVIGAFLLMRLTFKLSPLRNIVLFLLTWQTSSILVTNSSAIITSLTHYNSLLSPNDVDVFRWVNRHLPPHTTLYNYVDSTKNNGEVIQYWLPALTSSLLINNRYPTSPSLDQQLLFWNKLLDNPRQFSNLNSKYFYIYPSVEPFRDNQQLAELLVNTGYFKVIYPPINNHQVLDPRLTYVMQYQTN